MKIIITKRSDDFHACLDGQPEIWGCGKNSDEALGTLVRVHLLEKLNIEVERKNF